MWRISTQPAAVSFDDTIAGLDEDTFSTPSRSWPRTRPAAVAISTIISNTSVGVKFDWEMPFAGSISEVRLFADQTGPSWLICGRTPTTTTRRRSLTPFVRPPNQPCRRPRNTVTPRCPAGPRASTSAMSSGSMSIQRARSPGSRWRFGLIVAASSPALGSVQLGLIDRTAIIREPTLSWQQFLMVILINQAAQIHAPEPRNYLS